MTESFDLYKTLQVDPQAEPEVIRAAYRRLARKYHPDLSDGEEAAQRMAAINRAWEVLRDPGLRARYDQERGGDPLGDPRWMASSSGPREAAPSAGHWQATRGGRWQAPQDGGRWQAPSGQQRASTFDPRWGWGEVGPRPAERVSRDWTSGRSSYGSGYDERTMRAPDGEGAAGPPPGNPSGSVLNFGRYAGWSLGEIARRDTDFLEWLDRMPIGRPYRDEIDTLLRRLGRRRSAPSAQAPQRGLFRRR